LYGVVGRQSAAIDGYAYSKALKAHGKNWNFEELNAFLLKPKSYIKGTKMAYAGLRKDKDRASVILYLNSQSDNPLPKP
jgi:cytochrome c